MGVSSVRVIVLYVINHYENIAADGKVISWDKTIICPPKSEKMQFFWNTF